MKRLAIIFAVAAVLFTSSAAAQDGTPWTSREEVSRAARDLARDASQLSWGLWDFEDLSALAIRANTLSTQARHFRRRVMRPVPYQRLLADLGELQRGFHELRAGFLRAYRGGEISGLMEDWLRVSRSWERLVLEMGVGEGALCRPQQVSQPAPELLQPPLPRSQPVGHAASLAQFPGPLQSTSQAQD